MNDGGFDVPGFEGPKVRKVSDVYYEDTDACNRINGCPYGGRVDKSWAQYFCRECMAEMQDFPPGYMKRSIDQVRSDCNSALERFSKHHPFDDPHGFT
jgi:hypothetical protein